MADFFTIAEIIKYFPLDTKELFYCCPFVYQVKMSIQDMSGSYFITVFGAKDNTNKEVLNIQGVFINITKFYPPQISLNDCIIDEESCFFDGETQTLYIHYNHSLNPYSTSAEYGKTFGFTNDGIRKFLGVSYLSDLISIPNLVEKTDPLKYVKQAFYGGNINFNNMPNTPDNNGQFDTDSQLYGNDINILAGYEGNTYGDLIRINKNYISNKNVSFETANLQTKDKREQQSIKIPIDTFKLIDFPNIDEDLIDKIKPDGYGPLIDIPGICVNSESTGEKEFYFCSEIKDDPSFEVWAEKEKKWITVTPVIIDFTNGIVTLSIADSHIDGDNTKGLLNIKASGTFIDSSNGPDIIAEINERYLGIEFSSSNYNITEWNEEKQYLQPVGLYLDKEKNIYDWIGILQGSSTVGFLYKIEYGVRTIRLDNPNRNPIVNIQAVEIINNANLKYNDNAQLFATHAIIYYQKKYSKTTILNDSITQTAYQASVERSVVTVNYYESERYENRDYYTEVFCAHRKDQPIEIESLLTTPDDAIDKTTIMMEDLQKTRPIINVVLAGKKYFELRLFDIVMIELSYPGEKIDTKKADTWRVGITSSDIYRITIQTNVPLYKIVNYSEKDIFINQREFLGWQRMQVIGRKPNFDTGTIELTLRQRDFSQKYQEITGFTP